MRPSSVPLLLTVTAVLAISMVPVVLYGQSTSGTILGKIADGTGAVLTGAPVMTTNTLTGESRSTKTNEIGEYIFPGLPVGRYRVEAEASGFRRTVRNEVELAVNQNARVDLVLQVGAVEQVLEVTADATQVNTQNAQLGDLVDTKRVSELPLNGRNRVRPDHSDAGYCQDHHPRGAEPRQ